MMCMKEVFELMAIGQGNGAPDRVSEDATLWCRWQLYCRLLRKFSNELLDCVLPLRICEEGIFYEYNIRMFVIYWMREMIEEIFTRIKSKLLLQVIFYICVKYTYICNVCILWQRAS